MAVVLFLHGYGQNGEFFKTRRKLEKLEKELIKRGHACFFLDGSYRAYTIDNGCTRPCSWYSTIDTRDIDSLLDAFSPMNLILIGFSQGSVYMDAILRYYNNHRDKFSCNIQSAVFCAGHVNDTIHYTMPSLPTLHIWGIHDDCVEPALSKKLYQRYSKHHSNTKSLIHKKKHIFPIDSASIQTIIDFLDTP